MAIKKLDAAIKNSLIALIFSSAFNLPHCYADVSVGDSYEGGTVFCVSQTPDITKCVPQGSGKYGLIMASEDQVNFDSNSEHGMAWSSEYKETKALSDDDGAANTAAIIKALPQDNPSNNAAWLCSSYRGGGKEGWYLPSKNELNKMYLFAKANNLIGRDCAGSKPGGVQCLVGGGPYEHDATVYWSSTECSGSIGTLSYAWNQVFEYGLQCWESNKVRLRFGARAVRAFGISTIQQFNNLFSRGDVIAGALVVMNRDDEKLLQEVVSDSATDGRVKKLISSILKRNQLLERFTPILTRNNPSVSGTPMVAAAASPVVTQAAVDARVVALHRIMRDETFHNLTEEEHRLIVEIRNTQEEIIRGLQELGLYFTVLDLARKPDTDIVTLRDIVANRDANQQVLAAVAAHPHATPELLLNVLRRPDIDTPILQAIIANRNIDLSIIDMVALDPRANAEVLHAIAQNPITTTGILINVINHPNVEVDTLTAMVRHPNIGVGGLQALAAKGSSIDSNGLRAITIHPNVNAEILAAVAAHPNADYRLLFDLAARQDLGENVVLAIVRNSRANRFVLRRILQRPNVNLAVLRAIAQHPNTDAGVLTLVGEHNNTNSTLLSEIVPRLEAQPPQPVQPELGFNGAILSPPPPYS